MKILIVGGGNMGLTYAQSILRSRITKKEDLLILEKSPEKAVELSKKDIGTVCGDPEECLRQADLVVLAVKPQDSPALFETLKNQSEGRTGNSISDCSKVNINVHDTMHFTEYSKYFQDMKVNNVEDFCACRGSNIYIYC